ncbi:hypothetical protein Trydic_g23361 [Trypoxylus dichotomus]
MRVFLYRYFLLTAIPLPLKNSASKQSTKTTPRSKSEQTSECKLVASPKRTLELQFLTKKKRLDQLRKELELKQKPVFELYEALIQIKRKLEESGKAVPLETIKLVDYEYLADKPAIPAVTETPACDGEMVKSDVTELTAEFLNNIKLEMSAIPQTCLDFGSYLIKQRAEIIKYLTDLKEKDHTIDVEEFLEDTGRLNQMIDETALRQTARIERVLADINNLFEKNNLAVANQIIHELEKKIKMQQQEIVNLTNELAQKEDELNELRSKSDDYTQQLLHENVSLKERVKVLEAELQSKKRKLSDHGLSTKSYEQKIEILTKQVQDHEKAKKDAETKLTEITSHFRNLQNKVKFMEQKWRDEKEELLKNHKGEHAILEKLTAERQALDTRVHLMNNILDEQKKNYETEQTKLQKDLMTAKEQITAAAVEKQILEDKLKSLHQEVATLSLQQQQAVDVIKNTMDTDGNYMSENESQLNTEILALRVALKAAQDRIEMYTTEKMRFIDSIEKLNCSGDAKESLGKALVQKEEVITRLEHERADLNQEIEEQKVIIQQLTVQIDNLQAGAIVNNLEHIPHDTQELQSMLEEGKAKLQRALTKSLDNEQKLIRYEHDMNQQKKQLNDMENLLKVRDGLISMLKVKKDELVLENESLHRYSEEIRQLLFDTKEELKQKTELLDETNGHLDDKNKLCYKLEKKIRELETTLSETNEKRYKLQDTVGCMEKELQSTKAHINQIAEMQTRYDIGMPQLNHDVKQQPTKLKASPSPPAAQQYVTRSAIISTFKEQQTANAKQPTQLQMAAERNEYLLTQPDHIVPAKQTAVVFDTRIQPQYYPSRSTNHHLYHQMEIVSASQRRQLETTNVGDATLPPTQPNKPFYFVPERNIRHYAASYMRKNVQTAASNPIYRSCRSTSPYYRPLTQSLVDFETTDAKIRGRKRNSSPMLYNSQKHAKIQTASAPKLTSATQTDVQKATIDRYSISKAISDATNDQPDPYKLCCDMVSNERADIEAAKRQAEAAPQAVETKLREREEFITVVNKLSRYDSRQTRDKLGLGREFTPILFGGVSKYKVMDSGSLMWCHPSKEMQMNNMIIASDIKAHLPTKTKQKLMMSATNFHKIPSS